MSNISFACLQSLCSFSFFKSHDLRKTSLNRTSHLQLDRNETTVARSNPEDSNRASHYSSKKEPETPNKGGKEKVSLTEKDFRIMQVVGAGKNWKTYMVRKEGDKCLYAMKLIGKKRMAKNSVTDQVIMEKEILEKARHPFIPKLAWYFENDKKVFLVTEFIEGAVTLSQVLKNLSRFSEEISRFYSAEILLTLEYLHRDLQVVYNDFKLRHILLDSQGHIKMIDFAQAKKLIVPEAFKEIPQNGASFSIKEACVGELLDFWALGCIIYEMLTGKRPFCEDGEDNSDLDEMSPISQLSWPCSVSKNAKDLITRLLNRTVEDKLSFNSIEEIKKHAFFAQVNWEKMTSKSVYPPLILSQLKDKLREDYDIEDEGLLESEQIRLKYSKPSSLEKILEGSSAFNSDEGIDAVSFDRTTCINSVLGYR